MVIFVNIKPDKHFSVETSVIALTSIIIAELLKNKIIKYDRLFNVLKKHHGDLTLEEFSYCLMLLYSLGKIEYYKENDVIGLINYEIE